MSNFYLLCGMSGAGKSHLANIICEKHPELIHIDVDKYYEKYNGDETIRSNTFEVWQNVFHDIHYYLISGKDVLFDGNSLTEAQRNQFVEWFPEGNHKMLWLMADRELCFKNNASRYRVIPQATMEYFWDVKMEIPSPKEKGWDAITFVFNNNTSKYDILNLKGNVNELF